MTPTGLVHDTFLVVHAKIHCQKGRRLPRQLNSTAKPAASIGRPVATLRVLAQDDLPVGRQHQSLGQKEIIIVARAETSP